MAKEDIAKIISETTGIPVSKVTEKESDVLLNLEEKKGKFWQNGGTVIADPKGNFVNEPLIEKEGIVYADIDFMTAIEERQNFDYSGHYSRFDIFNKPLMGE